MTTVGLVNPLTLVGREIQAEYRSRGLQWNSIRLLTVGQSDVGTLTEGTEGAALIQAWSEETISDLDLVLWCGPGTFDAKHFEALPEGAKIVLLESYFTAEGAIPVVHGINSTDLAGVRTVRSPHPGAIALSYLLHPLKEFGSLTCTATIIEPVSMRDQAGMDELFSQTRSILAFDPERPLKELGCQLAFNLVPGRAGLLQQDLRILLGDQAEVSAQIARGGIFHCLSISLHLRLDSSVSPDRIRAVLANSPHLKMAEDPESLGPINAAAQDHILVGSLVHSEDQPGEYWLWCVMDNLTLGGASNALDLAQLLLTP